MANAEKVRQEIERLYESAALRDDLNDEEARVLIEWGKQKIESAAHAPDEEFEAQCRSLRQLMKRINRFVGQREFLDESGEAEYLGKVAQWLPPTGYSAQVANHLADVLPPQKSDMMQNLEAILGALDTAGGGPIAATAPETPPQTPAQPEGPSQTKQQTQQQTQPGTPHAGQQSDHGHVFEPSWRRSTSQPAQHDVHRHDIDQEPPPDDAPGQPYLNNPPIPGDTADDEPADT